MKTLWRYGKAQAGWSWVLPPAGLLTMFIWIFVDHSTARGGVHRLRDLYGIFEYYLPLATTFYLVSLPSFDRDQGAAEGLLTFTQWPSVRLLAAAAPRLAAWLAMSAGAAAIAHFWYFPASPLHLAAVTAAPALGLSGACLLGSALTRHQAGGFMASALWWVMDYGLPGKLHVKLFLFRVSHPLQAAVTAAEQTRNVCLAGAALWLLALWIAHRRPWWVR